MWELSDGFLDAFVERGLMTGGGCGIELFSLGGAISKVGENDTAYSNRGATFDFLPVATWNDPADDEHNISLTRKSWEALSRGLRLDETRVAGLAEGPVGPREHLPPECEHRAIGVDRDGR